MNKIPVFVRKEGAITSGDNWIKVDVVDTPLTDFLISSSLFETPKICITQSVLDSGLDWSAELQKHFKGDWYDKNPEYVAENNQGIENGTAVYEFREVNGERYAFISYLNSETVICLGSEY